MKKTWRCCRLDADFLHLGHFYTQFMAFFVELCEVLGIYEQINHDKKTKHKLKCAQVFNGSFVLIPAEGAIAL